MPLQLWLPLLACGLVLFLWRLGSSGLVDETPPLFAASARAMAETGDWLIPRVNGLPRYDKPPLVYWLMGLGYLLPGQDLWNPLGTWAARLPSALSSIAVMLLLADTLWRWPQAPWPSSVDKPEPASSAPPVPSALTAAFTAALAFALSPLVLLWGRIAVSDALLCGLMSATLLLSWRTYVAPRGAWWLTWLMLGLAVLSKGPVAVVLLGLALLGFGWLQGDLAGLWRRLRPLRGLTLTALVALPWYGAALLVEGEAFWNSFFGYHNLQRFSVVVNNHLQPWWFFLPVLVVASLPVTPLLLLGLVRGVGPLPWRRRAQPLPPEQSLTRFAACWLLAVLVFFTAAATKLPSYWLPATPAAALLIAQAAQAGWGGRAQRLAWSATLALTLLLAAVFLAGPLWVPAINDPELPTLPAEILASRRLLIAAACFALAGGLAWFLRRRRPPMALLVLQLAILPFVPLAITPLWELGDRLRGQPVRRMAELVRALPPPSGQGLPEPLAMVGILKPSLHYYARQVVLYEGQSQAALLNLNERLRLEHRAGQEPSRPRQAPTVLVVIDQGTARLPHWQGLEPQELGSDGLYRLWRLQRSQLQRRSAELYAAGERPNWQDPRPERY
ncbi:glycosyltransferase family 39 protein [Synechococcus sp. CBW1006]|uniref:ArnT family glycosyltransferase n=1 Tax=Synechococcus sp. CBW1006 TaxID=1353138 RepID=UPI0018CF0EA7|nr:glycosyltransferase family 39 protein [Synechococcus sp. CBW1006]QPN65333.1 glycosyltransferase family 39 protein [Synechococcus sp. CBW1006]